MAYKFINVGLGSWASKSKIEVVLLKHCHSWLLTYHYCCSMHVRLEWIHPLRFGDIQDEIKNIANKHMRINLSCITNHSVGLTPPVFFRVLYIFYLLGMFLVYIKSKDSPKYLSKYWIVCNFWGTIFLYMDQGRSLWGPLKKCITEPLPFGVHLTTRKTLSASKAQSLKRLVRLSLSVLDQGKKLPHWM